MSISCNLAGAPPAPLLAKTAYSTQRVFLLSFAGRGKLLTVLSSRCFWARPMQLERPIERPTAVQTFFEGEEESRT
jgi:hypothetical protein